MPHCRPGLAALRCHQTCVAPRARLSPVEHDGGEYQGQLGVAETREAAVDELKGDDKKEAEKNNTAARVWIGGLEA